MTIPPELLSRCKIVSEGTTGYIWDPFLANVRHEYLDCTVEGAMPRTVAFLQSVEISGQILQSPLHFDTRYYVDLHENTVTCMEQAIKGIDGIRFVVQMEASY